MPKPKLISGNRWVNQPCPECELDDGAVYHTEAEARAAWEQIGTRSLPWRRMTERPELATACLVLIEDGSVRKALAPFCTSGCIAWMYAADLPLPSWAKEGKA
jgi:hypothetical protein